MRITLQEFFIRLPCAGCVMQLLADEIASCDQRFKAVRARRILAAQEFVLRDRGFGSLALI